MINMINGRLLLISESGLFGVPLQTLLTHDQKKHPKLKVPIIFNEVIFFIFNSV